MGIASGRKRSRLAEHPAQEGTALLADVPEAVLVRGGVKGGRQPDIADHVLTARESCHAAEHQHGGQGGQWTDAGMGHEAPGVWIGGRGSRHLEIELVVDMAIQPVQELEAVIPAAAGVGQKHERLQLAVFDHRPDADESEPMFDEGAQVARRRIGNPDDGEAVVLQEVPEVPGVAPIGLGLAHNRRSDLRGLADEERMASST